jgi:hypothetical protein
MYASLTLPFVDADRRNPTGPHRWGLSMRTQFVVALVVLAVVWQVMRFLVR